MLVFAGAIALLTATFALTKRAARRPWPVFTMAAGIGLLWVALIYAAQARVGAGLAGGTLLYACIASVCIATIFLGGWMAVAAFVPSGRKKLSSFTALAGGGGVLLAIGALAARVLGSQQFVAILHVPVLATGLLSFTFAGYLSYGKLYSSVAHGWFESLLDEGQRPNAVIVLGSRTVDGQPTPLLSQRVCLGVEIGERIWLADPGSDRALLVCSGGSPAGSVEPPEAHVMAREARAQGVTNVLVEDHSTTTAENFRFCARLLDELGVPEPYIAVTSNFHAYRAAFHMERAGIDGYVIGGPSGSISVPFHILREFAAFLFEVARPSSPPESPS
ncbi:uncharacterized SAM-binding protein YcdF (DUF218 family) [Trueperella bonasi]|uniref:Uncharacterized SAM-binding protein YcdF (DUF218 family) n=1 Tax=Trueperella bonasi TaxID=312286 RepID=A0ABT9NF87_9ACTO|nr:YdcF family protein [Trueperella bonasi]MDP9806063.1 uncharacterized SAM-binding protein YcdF (DUF218 family) [Trueperella bonasi]